ncbi:MAG: DNA translocase FtsK 4TM domain-containing protein [Betaproteobacteria bacterium]|nr:DNA translocase FtsK 4TM domain-containing protein [Betaproteobacteria bacterium]
MAVFDKILRSPSIGETAPLPDAIAGFLRELRWLALIALAVFLALSLWGYDYGDPGWSHATHSVALNNPAGRAGAWLADLLLFVFGFSAWWWVAFCVVIVWRGYRRLDNAEAAAQRPVYLLYPGFAVLLVASCALENLRFYSMPIPLPQEAGGVIGIEVGALAVRHLGFTGATLALLALIGLSWSLFSGISWLSACERVGALLEASWRGIRNLIEYWRDRRLGREEAELREAFVEEEKSRIEHYAPIIIETPPELPPSPKIGKRIAREAQPPLFPEAVEGGLLPPLRLLSPAPEQSNLPGADTLEFTSRLIERKLADFGVTVRVLAAYPGPVVTRYEIEPATGVKGAQIVNLAKDLARALSLVSVRVVETVPGKSCMALELPNPKRQTVRLIEIINSPAYNDMHSPLTLTLGKDIGGLPVVVDLTKMPHLLVAGTTGSGKSVGINAMILSLVYKSAPQEVRLILVDPKMLELSVYEGIPHLLTPVVTDMKQAANALNWCVGEMDRRYKLMSALGVRNLAGFNAKIREAEKQGTKIPNPFPLVPESPEPLSALPYIVVVIDELADLMMVIGKKIEQLIARLAQKARAAGIHLILATQRPSVDVITGLIKANIPTRISFQVSSKIDSRTILDQMGAEALLGQGDMLYLAPGTGYPTRVHGAFVADEEVHQVSEYLKKIAPPDYVAEVLQDPDQEEDGGSIGNGGGSADGENDPLYDQAVEVVVKSRRASISLVQRHLRIGYNRSARLIETMEKAGIVSAMDGRGGREVLIREREE